MTSSDTGRVDPGDGAIRDGPASTMLFVPGDYQPDAVYISPLGGCGEFGKNLTLYIYRGSVYVVDCGIKFAEMWQPGIMGLIPNYDQIFAIYGEPTAYLLTHGHEDHIGAVPLFYEEWPAPIYTTGWTLELIKLKFEKFGLEFKQPPIVVKPYECTEFTDGLSVEWLPMNHSIPMTCSLVIKTPKLKIFHSGDFKFDPTPPYEAKTDLAPLKRLQPVDLLLVDSTNSASAGDSPSEKIVRKPLKSYLQKDYNRIFITTFASNLWRIKQIIEIAQELGRKIYAYSRAIETSIAIATELGLFDAQRYRVGYITKTTSEIPAQAIVLVSGCQGERLSTLAKIAQNRVRSCPIGAGDLVIFSSRPIPGNELAIIKLCESIKEKGTQVITVREDPAIHVSGHAHGGDIGKLISCLAPKTIMPVHGNYSHLDGVQKLHDGANVSIPANGDLFKLDQNGLEKVANQQFNDLFVDAESLVPLSFKTMKDRVRLGESGLCEVVGVLDKRKRSWLSSPRIAKMVGVIEEEETDSLCLRVKKAIASQLTAKNFAGLTAPEISDKVRILFRRQINLYAGKKTFVTCNIVEL